MISRHVERRQVSENSFRKQLLLLPMLDACRVTPARSRTTSPTSVKVTNIHNRVSRQETYARLLRKVHCLGLTPFYVVYGTPHRPVTMTTSVSTTTNAARIRLLRAMTNLTRAVNLRRTGMLRARYVTGRPLALSSRCELPN